MDPDELSIAHCGVCGACRGNGRDGKDVSHPCPHQLAALAKLERRLSAESSGAPDDGRRGPAADISPEAAATP